MFDAGYAITCRDAALAGRQALQAARCGPAAARVAAGRGEPRDLRSRQHRGNVPDHRRRSTVIDCKLKDADVGYRAYQLRTRQAALRGRGPRRLRQRASARPAQPRRRPARSRARFRSRPPASATPRLSPASRRARSTPDKALEEAYRRNNAGSYAEAAEFFAAASSGSATPRSSRAGGARQRSAAEIQPRPLCRGGFAVRPRRRAGRDRIRSSLAGCAIIAPSTTSTRAMPKDALAELDKPLPKAVADQPERRGRQARDRLRDGPSGSTPTSSSASSLACSPTNFCPPKRPRSSTARRCSCAALRCA